MATVSITATASSRSPGRGKAVARAAIVAGALCAAAAFLPASLASWADVDQPQLAVRIAPWSAVAAADAAAELGTTNPTNGRVRALVSRALGRDLTQVPAIELRALDLAVSGRPAEARRLFELSNQLSRRSLPTRLWLIQDAVDRGNVAGALRHFDIALRTTTDAQPILFPVLGKASADPTLTEPLARMLDRPSDWRLMYLNWAVANSKDVTSTARVVAHMRDSEFVVSSGIDQRLIERLASARGFAEARLLNQRFGRSSAGIADPNFADPGARYPFGWGLVSNASLGAERILSGSSSMLGYRAAPANSGQVAAQLLTLVPGKYALNVRTGLRGTGTPPYWSVLCGDGSGGELARVEQPLAANGTAGTTFVVPAGCSAQWLTLRVRPAADAAEQSGAVASVSISPA